MFKPGQLQKAISNSITSVALRKQPLDCKCPKRGEYLFGESIPSRILGPQPVMLQVSQVKDGQGTCVPRVLFPALRGEVQGTGTTYGLSLWLVAGFQVSQCIQTSFWEMSPMFSFLVFPNI